LTWLSFSVILLSASRKMILVGGLEMALELKTVYFEKQGRDNTDEVLNIARERAEELGIKTILMATTVGDTAAKAVDFFGGMKVVAVTHVTGMRGPNVQEVTDENRATIKNGGGVLITASHAFTGIGGAMRKKHSMYLLGDIIADTLRIFGAGMKVVCEIALMAADAGAIPIGEDVVAIAGSGRGADTAVVLSPANTSDFFDMRIKEVLCKPHSPVVAQRPPQGQPAAAGAAALSR
ncbi:MAG: pyruvate kinase alpha/beta domain-containing protein, partial [Dehalococcoidales bacterium]|nr:pyruvate kinase alpha/beta domain-containing protein [Dehalococcoidales bacterium]